MGSFGSGDIVLSSSIGSGDFGFDSIGADFSGPGVSSSWWRLPLGRHAVVP